MKTRSLAPVFAALVVVLAPATGRTSDAKYMEKELNRAYGGRVLILRNFYSGSHLRYGADGRLLDPEYPGSWTLNSNVEVKQIKLRSGRIEIDGKRHLLVYDQDKKQFESAGNLRNVRIDVEEDTSPVALSDIRNVLAKVFLWGTEKLEDFAPPYWRMFFSGANQLDASGAKKTGTTQESLAVTEFKPGSGITPPVPLHRPEPPYTGEARRARLQGAVVMWLVIDKDGKVEDILLLKPLGLGLDEQAVSTVSTWRFKPATKDGVPVAVRVTVQVTFRLL